MQEKTFTGASLEKALKNDALTRSGIELVGMVKSSEKAGHISFTRSGCDTWVDLPSDMIEQAEHLGQNTCKDHSHPMFMITLKEAKSPEAQILSALLAQPTPMPTQVGSMPTQAGPIPQMFSGIQGQGAFGSPFLGVGPKGTDGSFIVSLPQTSARIGNGGFGGGGLGFSCFGNVCVCGDDADCNGMFSTVCGGSYAQCWVRGGTTVFCMCSRR